MLPTRRNRRDDATLQMASPLHCFQRLPRDCAAPAFAPRFLASDGLTAACAEVVLPAPRPGCPIDAAVARGLAVDVAAAFFDVALDAPVAATGLPGVFTDRVVLPALDLVAIPDDATDACCAPAARLSDAGLPVTAGAREGDFFDCFA